MHNLIKITIDEKEIYPTHKTTSYGNITKPLHFVAIDNCSLQYLSRIQPPMLNADSEAKVVIGILIMSRPISESSKK